MRAVKKIWINLPVKIKILSYYFVLIALLFSMLSVFNHNNTDIVNQLNETIDSSYKVHFLMEKTSQDVRDVEKYLYSDDKEALEAYLERKEEVQMLLKDLYSIQSSLESYFSINAIEYSVKAYTRYFANAIAKKQNSEKLFYVDYYKGAAISEYTNQYFQDLLLESLKDATSKAKVIEEETNTIRKTSYALIIIISVLALILGLVISNYIVGPIKKLSDYSKEISSGKLDILEVDITTKDEVGDLSRAFNHMTKSIKVYVQNIKEKANIEKKLHEEEKAVMQMEQLLQQAKLEALQARINPHFLFNTLNAISRTALFEDAQETMGLIQRLSKIFRYQLRRAGEKVTLNEEKRLILDYLALQRVRFKDRLKYDVDIPEYIHLYIPILTLQPLIENAIIHGIEPRINGGSIRIKVREQEEAIIIKIIDTGVGIDEGTVTKINSDREIEKKSKTSIGIKNVKQRFLLSFPNKSGFVVLSKKNCGTVIKMVINSKEALNDV